MSITDLYLNATLGITLLAMFYLCFYFLWQRYVIDVTRHQLFGLRDSLFDLASGEHLPKESEAYKVIREMLNAGLRFTHKMGIIRLMAMTFRERPEIRKYADRVEKIINDIEDYETRQAVMHTLHRMQTFLMIHIIKRSLLLIIALPIILVFCLAIMFSMHFYDKFRHTGGELVNALAYGDAIRHSPGLR